MHYEVMEAHGWDKKNREKKIKKSCFSGKKKVYLGITRDVSYSVKK